MINNELLLIKDDVLEILIGDEYRKEVNKQYFLVNNEEKFIENLKSLVTDLILENNEDYCEEVTSFEEYVLFNNKLIQMLKRIYDYELKVQNALYNN